MNIPHRFAIVATLGLALVPVASSEASTIVYNFNDTIAYAANLGLGSPVSLNDFGSGITASNWTAISPIRTIGVQGGVPFGQVRALKSEDTDTHQFTITIPDLGGPTVDLTNLSFNYGVVGGDTAPPTWTISSTVGTLSPNAGTIPWANPASSSANMTLSGMTGLNNTSVTFTLLDNSQGNNKFDTMYTWFDNVTLTGTIVPVPEPLSLGVAASVGLGLVFLIGRRRGKNPNRE